MSCPASVIVPEVGVSRPATIRSVVVLPHPDGPSRAKNAPAGTSRSIDFTAVKLAELLGQLAQLEARTATGPGRSDALRCPCIAGVSHL